ncbi:hypothetical protein JTB14_008924 [Gonioctena quinquepunctata]|nr:hypothetical protein JTB14_008924 [Gonioctena quinquepunctata]
MKSYIYTETLYKLLEESSPEHWRKYQEKFPSIQGLQNFERGPDKYMHYENVKLEDKDEGSKFSTNSGTYTPSAPPARNKADNNAGDVTPSEYSVKEIEDIQHRIMLLSTMK